MLRGQTLTVPGPVKEFVATVEAHWDGIIAWQQSRLSNGLLEGTNSLVQAAKCRAGGYRSKAKMITISYLVAGKLPLPQNPHDLARSPKEFSGGRLTALVERPREPSCFVVVPPAPLR